MQWQRTTSDRLRVVIANTVVPISIATHLQGFNYAIRNIMAEARKVEQQGDQVHYLNIGDPVSFGFETPPHLIEAVERAMHDGDNGYKPGAGIISAREAVAREYTSRGVTMSPDRVILTSGTSRRYRVDPERARRSRRRGSGSRADLPVLHGRARQAGRQGRLLSNGSDTRMGAPILIRFVISCRHGPVRWS